jgi:hypothetical protein
MTSERSWFEAHPKDGLEQGDVLLECPRLTVTGMRSWPYNSEELAIDEERIWGIVLTQSCDLAHGKTVEVLLARVKAWTEAVAEEVARGNQIVKSTAFRKALVEGNVPGMSLLHEHTGEPRFPWSVVNFHELFVLPKELVTVLVKQTPCLRLVSPYKEHVAQAFARYMMRVGLPHDAKAFMGAGSG